MKTRTHRHSLTAPQTRILEFLKTYRDLKTGECTPSLKQIATAVGLSRDYTRHQVAGLVKSGVLDRQERWEFSGSGETGNWCEFQSANLYRVLIAFLLTLALSVPNGPMSHIDGVTYWSHYVRFLVGLFFLLFLLELLLFHAAEGDE